eukprot:4488632-Pyramimonas_sp.AAC.1
MSRRQCALSCVVGGVSSFSVDHPLGESGELDTGYSEKRGRRVFGVLSASLPLLAHPEDV